MKNFTLKHLLLPIFLIQLIANYAQSPNILLIIADDLGVDALNGYNLGNITPTTPHLDSLRNSGLTFMNAWSSPVCTPTRAGMMSGKHGSKNGVKTTPGNLNLIHHSLLNNLKDSNSIYTTAVTGKWHISMPVDVQHPTQHGADHYMGVMLGTVANYSNWSKTENYATAISTDYVTSYFTDDAIGWINNQNSPWLMWLAHVAPHSPFHAPPAYMHTQTTTNSLLTKYMAMIESLDYEVGRLLDSLSPAELLNTTIIFIGDNGTPNNVLQDYPQMHGKQSLYQGGIHVPMFVSGYGVTRNGETENALINLIDIHATILELTGSELEGGIYNSLSFKNLLTNPNATKRNYNFSELDSNATNISTQGFAIRDSVYKLIEFHDGQQEFYNLIIDPLETNNLMSGSLTPALTLIKEELKNEATVRITSWSCNDNIKNGDELGIDCGGSFCSPCNSLIEENKSVNFTLFPNPSAGELTIKTQEKIELVIFNLEGKIMNQYNLSKGNHYLDLTHLSSGLYIVEGSSKSRKTRIKLTLEH